MNLLDELKNQAEQKQAVITQQEEDKALKQQIYREQILPRMQSAYHFMDKLVEYLTMLDDHILVSDYTSKYPELSQLEQCNYRLSSDTHGGKANIDKIEIVSLRYDLRSNGSFLLKVSHQQEIESEINFLHSHRVPFKWKRPNTNSDDNFVNFTIEKRIPVLVQIKADIPNSQITLDIYNQENFEDIHRVLKPEALTDDYLDELGRYLLRKDREFVRIEIEEVQRHEIQKKLELEKKQREEELAAIEAAELAEQQAQQEQTIKHKLKGFIGQLKK